MRYIVIWSGTGRVVGKYSCWKSKQKAEEHAKICNDSLSFIAKLLNGGHSYRVITLREVD